MNKNLAFIILLVTLLLASCGGSGGKSTPDPGITPGPPAPPGESPVTPSIETIVGIWDCYNYQKRATGPSQYDKGNKTSYDRTLRYFESDGYSYDFRVDGSFKEIDPRGVTIASGTYKILPPQGNQGWRIEFIFSLAIAPTQQVKRTMTIANLTQYRFSTIIDFAYEKVPGTKITDTRVFRNRSKLGNQHPGVEKELIQQDKLIGEWLVTDALISNDGAAEKLPDELLGTKIKFNSDYTFKQVAGDGSIKEGIYVISDDVVNIYWNMPPSRMRLPSKQHSLSMFDQYLSIDENLVYSSITESNSVSTRITVDPYLSLRETIPIRNWKTKDGKSTFEKYYSHTTSIDGRNYLIYQIKRTTYTKIN